jgi:hypothetical protein
MMKIKNITWESKEDLEASVVITDGEFEVTTFCQPCKHSVGDIISEALISIDTMNIVRSYSKTGSIKVDERKYHYTIIAKVDNAKTGVVSVGRIKIDIGILPGDIIDGDYIEFVINRLDL